MPVIAPVTTDEILDELDHAIIDHLAWLQAWHRALICSDPPFAGELAYDPHHLCRFGSWYVKNQHKGLVNQPVIRSLAALHKDLHDRAQDLAHAAQAGETIGRDAYDAFMDTANAFIGQARRLEKAFAAASSELDPLTGLHNRQIMSRELERERARVVRTGRPSCVALADLDHFKEVNDTFGHAAGDRVLQAAAECFLARLRPYDLVFRYGGEEFLFCLPDTPLPRARDVLERLRAALEAEPVRLDTGERLAVTASFGTAEMTPDTATDASVERADQALYWAKSGGRNQVRGWDGPDEVENLAGA